MMNSLSKVTVEDPSALSKKPSLPAAGGNRRRDKRAVLPGIWSARDRPGPATWRRDSGAYCLASQALSDIPLYYTQYITN
jgi:hypothetical protein